MNGDQTCPRRRAFRTLAAMEFRVGLYWWLTRVLTRTLGPAVWAVVAAAVLFVGQTAWGVSVAYALWAGAVTVVCCWALSMLLSSELQRPHATGPAPRSPLDPGTLHLVRLLPVSPGGREFAAAAGRLGGLAAAIAVGFALLLASNVTASLTGQPRQAPASLEGLALASVSLWGVLCLARVLVRKGLGAPMRVAAVALYITGYATISTLPTWLRPWVMRAARAWPWVPATLMLVLATAWVLLTLALGGARCLLWRAVARRRLEPRLPGRSLLDVDTWREAWGRLGVPEAGWAGWWRALQRAVGLAGAGLAPIVGGPWLVHVLRHPHSRGPWLFAIGFAPLAIPLGAIPLVLALWPGDFAPTPTPHLTSLLPLLPRDLWRVRLRAAAACALGSAGVGELLGLGALGLARLLGQPLGHVSGHVFWSPLLTSAVALLLWAQQPLFTYPIRVGRWAEWVWLGMVFAAVCPAAIAAFWLDPASRAWLPAAAGALWAVAAGQLALSRRTADPRVWPVDESGHPTATAKAAFLGVAASSAISLAVLAFCCVVAVGLLAAR